MKMKHFILLILFFPLEMYAQSNGEKVVYTSKFDDSYYGDGCTCYIIDKGKFIKIVIKPVNKDASTALYKKESIRSILVSNGNGYCCNSSIWITWTTGDTENAGSVGPSGDKEKISKCLEDIL